MISKSHPPSTSWQILTGRYAFLPLSHLSSFLQCAYTDVDDVEDQGHEYNCSLKVNRGKIHDYLGMNLDFSEDGNVKVSSMIPYLLEILRDFPELLGDTAMSPAADHLFKVRSDEEARLLPEEQAISFHHF